jgi:hypothetical protein
MHSIGFQSTTCEEIKTAMNESANLTLNSALCEGKEYYCLPKITQFCYYTQSPG